MESSEIALRLHINHLQKQYNLPSDFISDLKEEDDWSFIIKLHALFEALLATLITEFIGKKELTNFFTHLDIGGRPIGKLEMIKSLNLLTKEQIKFVKRLSELRNSLVHNISEVSFSLKNHIHNLDPNQFKSFANDFGFNLKEDIRYTEIKKTPKICLWASGITLLAEIQEEKFKHEF